jgi:ribonuclease D
LSLRVPETTPLIADADAFRAVAARLGDCHELAIDTESNSLHSYQERVCLIQITARYPDGAREHAIIDPLAIADLSALAAPLADPRIVKILHGANYDVLCLKRDYGFTFCNLFDTMIAAQISGIPKYGLADLVESFFGVTLDKRFQKHDWALRPLTDEQRLYAILDTYYLPELREHLVARVAERGRTDQLQEELERLEDLSPAPPMPDIRRVRRIKGAARLTDQELRVLLALWRLRERLAEELDRPVFKVISNQDLLLLACDQPRDAAALKRTLRPRSPAAGRYAKEVLDAIHEGLADDTCLHVPCTKESNGRLSRSQERQLVRLKEWRNATAKREEIEPALVANNDLLRRIAQSPPSSLAELVAIDGMRGWQVTRYADAIFAVLTDTGRSGAE